jgi:hypothetical protein
MDISIFSSFAEPVRKWALKSRWFHKGIEQNNRFLKQRV